SIGYNVCVAVFGGTTPYIVTWLTATTGDAIAPAYYLVIAAMVSLGVVLTLRESAGRSLTQVR
ncbi:MAG: MFS transporter, partial [Mycobacterium sp.]|nr:MFS transporter [Mycobacterium sp.]